MSDDKNLAVTISDAWALHRNAQNEEATAMFDTVIAKDADNVDAHYGKGLALRALGKKDAAIAEFRTAHHLSMTTLEALRKAHVSGPQHAADNLQITDDDRFSTLVRMTAQRLQELGVKVAGAAESIF